MNVYACMYCMCVCTMYVCISFIYGTYRQNIYSSEYVCILNYAYEIELILSEIDQT